MKVCVFGAGAIGGHVAARLAHAQSKGTLPEPVEVSVVARGAHLEAIRRNGITLKSVAPVGEETINAPVEATDDPGSLTPQDLVVVTLKAHSTPGAAAALARLTAPGGCALFIANGLPWWWRHGLKANAGAGESLRLLDPQNALWNTIGPQRALGGVVYSVDEVIEPGVVRHRSANQWIFGEPDGSESGRLSRAVEMFKAAGMAARASTDIRREVWKKLLSNSIHNPVSALTRLDGAAGGDEGLRALKKLMLAETLAVAAATGWDLRAETDIDAVVGVPVKGNRPSMLQDVLAGRPIEVEALLGQLQAFAREFKVDTPRLDVVLPLLRGVDLALRQPPF